MIKATAVCDDCGKAIEVSIDRHVSKEDIIKLMLREHGWGVVKSDVAEYLLCNKCFKKVKER